jgi:proteasome assembly chaperone (PAC2) family protein
MDLILGQPPLHLRRPILVAGFGGWSDAGSAATIALRHVLGEEPPAASAMVDPSACFDFTVARPLSTRRADGKGWQLEYPKVAFHPVVLPTEDRDLLLLTGPEPHLRWPEIAPAVIAYARRAGAQMLLTFGAYVGAVSHHAAPLTCRTLDATLGERLADLKVTDTSYEGPTAFVTALLHAAAAVDLPAASLWVATPPYLQAGNPVAALALLDLACRLVDLPLNRERLRDAATSFQRDVDAALAEHPELAEQLQEMLDEVADDDDDEDGDEAELGAPTLELDRPPADAPPGLPTGQALVEAVERYLRQGRGDLS